MTERLQADLELDVGSALRSVEELRREVQQQLSEAIDSFADAYASAVGSLPTIEPEIETGAIAPEIEGAVAEADTVIEPEADASGISAEIETAVDEVEAIVPVDADVSSAEQTIQEITADDVEIAIVADASQAESEIQDLTNAVEDVGVELGGFASSTDIIAGGTRAATGELAGMTAGLETLGDKVGLPLTGVLALAGATTLFTTEAIDALGATQRFEGTLGDMAERVENLDDIEGLNTNLSELALTLGSDDDKIRNVVARLYELARASGVNNEEAALFVQQMTVMGARAVALNPQLGDVGDVTDALSTALVRGGRFAAKFGLDLNQAEINSRALKDTSKGTSEELTFVEKAMAGAAIASEKYGGNLEEIIARGSENAITTQRRLGQAIRETVEELGQPLIVPVFDVLAEGQPVAEATGRILSALGQIILPLLVAAIRGLLPFAEATAAVLEAIAPPLEAVATFLSALPAPILAAAIGFAALPRVMQTITDLAVPMVARLGGSAATIASIEGASTTATTGLIGVQQGMLGVLGPAALLAGAAGLALYTLGAFGEISSGVEVSLAAQGDGARKLGDDLQNLAEYERHVAEEVAFAQKAQEGLTREQAIARSGNSGLQSSVQILAEKHRKLREEVADLAATNLPAARTFLEIAKSAGIEADELERLTRIVERNAGAYEKRVRAEATAQIAAEQFQRDVAAEKEALDSATAAADAQAEALKRAADAVDQFASDAVSKFPTVDAAFAETQRVAEHFALNFIPINVLEDQIRKASDAIAAFPLLVQALFNAGLDNVAQLVIDQGPIVGGALARQVLDAVPEVGKGLDGVLGQYDQFTQNTEGFLRGTAGPRLTGAFQDFHDKYPEISYDTFRVLQGIYSAETGVMGNLAGQIGDASTSQFGAGVDGMPPATQAALGGVAGVMNQNESILGSQAHIAGLVIGTQLGSGIWYGIHSWSDDIATEMGRIVDRAEAAAREAARAQSPSRLFAELGEDMTEGLGMGMERAVPDVVLDAESVVADLWAGMRSSAPVPPERVAAGVGAGVSSTSIDRSVNVYGGINNYGPDPDSRGTATMRRLRDFAHLAGGW